MGVKIKQRDITDCGAACIASVASHYRLHLPIARIRQLAFTDKKGTNVLGLLEALTKLGFQAKGVRGSVENLNEIPKPAIAHVVVREAMHHYVVIHKTYQRQVVIMDPADGKMHRYTFADFAKQWTGVMVILVPSENFKPGQQRKSAFSQLASLIRPHKAILIEVLIGALAYTLIGLTTSIYVQKIVDYVLVDGNRNLLNLMSLGMIGLLLLQVFIGAMKSILTLNSGQSIDAALILGYYQHLLRLPQQFFDSMRVGEIISRVNDAVKIRSFVNEALTAIAVNILIVILSFALMFTYYWKLALVMLLMIPFYALVYAITNRLNKTVERKMMESSAELESQWVESLNGIRTIKSLGLEYHASLRSEMKLMDLLKKVYSSGLNSIFTNSSSEFLSRLFTIILLWAGAGFVLGHELTPGELLSFYALIGYFTGPVSGLIASNKVIQNAVIAADRLFEILDLEVEKDEQGINLLPHLAGDIRFVNVGFRYGTRATVFDQLNFEIPKGKVTAIVGESGSGKSTVIGILQRLYPIQSGQVMIGKYNLQNIRKEFLNQYIAVVQQKTDLFSGSILENIALGDSEPDVRKVLDICLELGLQETIDRLPEGLNTYLGENGLTLSGGQRQRIAIGRALYRNPELLILDEATASLDSQAEQYVRRVVDQFRKQSKTVVIIAHRLSTIQAADKIVVIHEGKVSEEGTHSELIQQRKNYHRLWTAQFPVANSAEMSVY